MQLPLGKWVPIPEFPQYLISEDGRVLSLHSGRPRVLKPWLSYGYPRVGLYRYEGGKRVRRKVSVHRIVALVFLGPPPSDEHEVSHIDGDAGNPSADNLEWVTHEENCARKEGHGTKAEGEDHYASKLTLEQAVDIFMARWRGEPKRALARKYGVSQAAIQRLLRLDTAVGKQAWEVYMEKTNDPLLGIGL